MQYYIDKYGGDISRENIKLYFSAWFHGSRKSKIDFTRWPVVQQDRRWDRKDLKGAAAYAEVIGVKGDFIKAMLEKLEAYRTRILGGVLKKFTSKTGRYYSNWKQMEQKLMNKLRSHPENLAAVGNFPAFAPGPLIADKGRSNKAETFRAGVRQALLLGNKSKNITQYTGARLTAKVRNARRKTRVYYDEFKTRYGERLRRQGTNTSKLTENNYIKAFLTATPRGSTPLARSINMMTGQNIYTKGNMLMRNAKAHHEKNPRSKSFTNTKSQYRDW